MPHLLGICPARLAIRIVASERARIRRGRFHPQQLCRLEVEDEQCWCQAGASVWLDVGGGRELGSYLAIPRCDAVLTLPALQRQPLAVSTHRIPLPRMPINLWIRLLQLLLPRDQRDGTMCVLYSCLGRKSGPRLPT